MIKAIIKISRPLNFLITFCAVLIAALITKLDFNWGDIIAAAFAMSFACSAGNVFNDIVDIEIDRINKPSRILPSKKLSINSAKILYVILLLFSLTSAVYNGLISILALVIINLLLIIYSFYLKKVVLLKNFAAASLTASALIYGSYTAGNISAGYIPAVFALLTNLIREIIKDYEDVAGDSANNVITFSKVYGTRNTFVILNILAIVVFLFSFIPYFYNIYNIEFFIIMMTIVNPLFIYSLKLIYISPDIKNLKKASEIVKLNMIVGLAAIYIGT